MTLCKKSKIPTQHVTARYQARSYLKDGPKKTSLGGPLRHLKFGQNDLLVAAMEMKDIWSPASRPWSSPPPRCEYKAKSIEFLSTESFNQQKVEGLRLQGVLSGQGGKDENQSWSLNKSIPHFFNLFNACFTPVSQCVRIHMVVQNGCRDGPLAWGCRRRVDVCQTLTVEGDPLDLLFWTLLLDMILLGT